MNIKTGVKNNRKVIKITSMSILGLLAGLTFALIPINIFCVNFPEWVTVLLSVFFCGGLVAYLIVFKTKLVTKIILPTVFGLVAIICSFLPNPFTEDGAYGDGQRLFMMIRYPISAMCTPIQGCIHCDFLLLPMLGISVFLIFCDMNCPTEEL